MRAFLLLMSALLLGGCLAKTAIDVATLPVKAASFTVDKLTTSQAEADRNRGRAMRKQEEREAKERRREEKEQRRLAREQEKADAEDYPH